VLTYNIKTYINYNIITTILPYLLLYLVKLTIIRLKVTKISASSKIKTIIIIITLNVIIIIITTYNITIIRTNLTITKAPYKTTIISRIGTTYYT